MAFAVGLRFGPYEITALVGQGGMGQVWKARDERLARDVAIKVLPETMASDPEQLARFERESHALAALDHPHIATVHGIEETPHGRALVMEFVPGPTIDERLASGRIELSEILVIARDLASALEAAHERAIIHRDVKPANLKLTNDGRVKVLDFGLAKTEHVRVASASTGAPAAVITTTAHGQLVGTAAYMSPEQARGAPVDRRADIWGYGCVLYELLARRRAFTGDSMTDVLAKVVTSDPDWTALRPDTPPALRLLVERCLRRDARSRLRDIGDARVVLEDLVAGREPLVLTAAPPTPRRFRLAWLALAALALAAGAAAGWLVRGPGEARPVRRLELTMRDATIDVFTRPRIAPDGHAIVYGAAGRLWLRRLDSLEPRELAGSEGAETPFWSHDSRAVAFAVHRRLWRVAADGSGEPLAVCDLPGNGRIVSGAWQENDVIVFSAWQGPLFEVGARGGDPKVLLPVAPSEVDFHELVALPGNRGLLFVRHEKALELQHVEVLASGQRTIVLEAGANARFDNPRFAPPGFLVYERLDGNAGVWVAPFSLDTLRVSGEPVRLAAGATMPGVAHDGTLIYAESTGSFQLSWVNRAAERTGNVGAPLLELQFPALSPDGTRVVVAGAEPENIQDRDLWLQDLVTGTRTRLQPSATPTRDVLPTWAPDGRTIYHLQLRRDPAMLVAVSPHRTGSARDVTPANTAVSFSRDGRHAVFGRISASRRMELWRAEVSGDPPTFDVRPFLQGTAGSTTDPKLSPDGRYVAYTSDESGTNEIYLRRFPAGDEQWRVSTEGGTSAAWNVAGTELYYRGAHGALMAVTITLGPQPVLSPARRLFDDERVGARAARGWDVSADGQRFLVVGLADAERRGRIVVVQNWLAELGRE